MEELIKITTNDNGKQLVSARELYEFLGLSKRFSAWFETYSKNEDYGFIENEDFTSVLTSTVVNNGAKRELQDYAITIEMAKELSMLSKSQKGKEARKYFIQCEKKLKEKETTYKLPQTYKEALLQLVEQVEANEQLQLENKNLSVENRLLQGEKFEWADTSLINAMVRKYSTSVYGDFAKGWTEWKKNLLYKYGININSRITAYLNKTGKKTKPKTLSMLKTDEEVSNGIITILTMCKDEDIKIDDIIKHQQESFNKE